MVLVVSALVVVVGGLFGSAWWLTKAWPATSGRVPNDLHGETVVVPWSGGTLQTWIFHADGEAGAVLLLHGWRGRREWMLGRVRMLLKAGYSAVVPDLPAHGESTGDAVTFGIREGEAVDALLEFMQTRFPLQPRGAIGVSLGGVSLLMARRDVPLQVVVLESVFPTLYQAVEDRMRRFLTPAGGWLTPLLVTAVELFRDVSPESVRPIDRIGSLGVPVLCLHGSEDRSTPIEEARALFAAASEPKELWEVKGAAHEDLRAAATVDYDMRIVKFLKKYLEGA